MSNSEDAFEGKLSFEVNSLSLAQLQTLQRLVDQRIKFILAAAGIAGTEAFQVGDKVRFHSLDGWAYRGAITEIRERSAMVQTTDGKQFEVSLQVLLPDAG